ncbi:AAA family ATPase [Sorangium sp. So ce388]|uniref:AAA family ATPase n=1 Tax=Sorangium sp. So ce388 TaxID=3133309 RepID=UPI003F5C88BD
MRITARNFLGLAQIDWQPSGVCLIAGPNGSGKTTLLESLDFLGRSFQKSTHEAVRLLGGGRGLKHKDAPPDQPVSFVLEEDGVAWELDVSVSGAGVGEFPGERVVVEGKTLVRRVAGSNEWTLVDERRTDGPEDAPRTCLRAAWEALRLESIEPLVRAIQNIRVYDAWWINQLRQSGSSDIGDSYLHRTGRNLFSVLKTWRAAPRRHNSQFEWVRDKARLAFYDIFDDIELSDNEGFVSARFFPPGEGAGSEGLPIVRAADGLLVGLLHLTAVAGARPGSLVGLDEMENQLHPHAIRVILEAMREMAEERDLTVVLTTHSPVLMNEFRGEPEQFYVTEVGRVPGPVRLVELHDPRWLSQFALGDLYEQLRIGAPSAGEHAA